MNKYMQLLRYIINKQILYIYSRKCLIILMQCGYIDLNSLFLLLSYRNIHYDIPTLLIILSHFLILFFLFHFSPLFPFLCFLLQVVSINNNDQFLLLACDGLYDVFSNEEIIKFVLQDMVLHGDTQKCCQNLTYEANHKRKSRENVTVIIVILNKWY